MRNSENNLQEMTSDEISDFFKIFDEESQDKKKIELKNFAKLKEARLFIREATQIFDESIDFYGLRKRQASQFLTIYKDALTDNDVDVSEKFKDEAKLLCEYLHTAIITLQQLEEKTQRNQFKSKQKISAKFYALHYLLESKANGKIIPIGEKIKLEKIGSEKYGIGGNSFYKKFNEYENRIDKETLRIEFGSEWMEVVKGISPNDEILKKYLIDNYL